MPVGSVAVKERHQPLVLVDTAGLSEEEWLAYIEASGNDAITSGRLTPELNHLLSSAFYTGMFEVIIHDMPKAQALEHIRKMRRFYTAGWQTIFSTDGGDVV